MGQFGLPLSLSHLDGDSPPVGPFEILPLCQVRGNSDGVIRREKATARSTFSLPLILPPPRSFSGIMSEKAATVEVNLEGMLLIVFLM